DFTFRFKKEQSGLSFVAAYNKRLYDERTVDKVMRHLIALYRHALLQPTEPLNQLPFVTEDELVELSERAKLIQGPGRAAEQGMNGLHPLLQRCKEQSIQRWVFETEMNISSSW